MDLLPDLIKFYCDCLQLTGEIEKHIIPVHYRRAGIESNVEGLVQSDAVGDALLDATLADLLVVGVERHVGAG